MSNSSRHRSVGRSRDDRSASSPDGAFAPDIEALAPWGWRREQSRALDRHLAELTPRDGSSTLDVGRVVTGAREVYRVRTAGGEVVVRPSGRLRSAGELPAVGDWVVLRGDQISTVLERQTRLSRKAAGERTVQQVVAANVDVVFLVMGLDGDFNLRRIERFVTLARDSGVEPVVVLTKADLCPADELAERRADTQLSAPGVPVLVTSSVDGTGFEPLAFYLEPGRTVALLGSSGVGKSTLINRLAGEEILRTGAVRAGDDRGKHTTTHRELVQLPGGDDREPGALLIDNPGIRELQLWTEGDGPDGLGEAFADIAALAEECRFRDCGHVDEPGCAVLAAVDSGALDAGRLRNLRTLEKEQRSLELRQDVARHRQHERSLHKMYRSVQKSKRGRR